MRNQTSPAVHRRKKRRRRRVRKSGVSTLILLTVLAMSAAVAVLLGASPQGQTELISKEPQTTERPQTVERPSSTSEAWNLILVNPWNPLPDFYAVTLTQLKNGHSVDERCYPELQAMMDDCRAAGLSPLICSSYRTRQTQEKLFNNQVNKWIAKGYSRADAETQAGKSVAVPGTSEHQTGLALDIVDLSNQNLDKTQESTPVQQWLMEHSWEYGFILRYPNGKSDVTGIIYEPWHYRYVGKDAAKEIHERGIFFEEYLAEGRS